MNTEENLQKVAYLHEHRIDLINREGNIFITASKADKTLKQVVEEINKKIFRGEEEKMNSNYPITAKLRELGYQEIKKFQGGRIEAIKVTTTFRKK